MSDIYAQLFDSYAHDVQRHLKESEDETFAELIQVIPMSDEHKMDLTDRLTALRSRCCEESLLLGIVIGLRLNLDIRAF